ncbi:MAG: gas vesicle protein [Deltaproteobacteria bacterium]|nr:gas vesicle protein [Deltaproteobacteria bacterium]
MTMDITDVILKAREKLNKVTGLELATTLKTNKDEKGWHVSVEMIEKHSIPDGMDILATYEAILDDSGNLLEFNRQRMRKRMETVEP